MVLTIDVYRKGGGGDPCLLLPCLGAGHNHSVILGKLRNARLNSFSQELRVLVSQSSSLEYKLYRYK